MPLAVFLQFMAHRTLWQSYEYESLGDFIYQGTLWSSMCPRLKRRETGGIPRPQARSQIMENITGTRVESNLTTDRKDWARTLTCPTLPSARGKGPHCP